MKKKILDYLNEQVKDAYKERDLTKSYYLDLALGYSVVLAWEEGFDTEDEHELCISLRISNSSYFVSDWDVVEESSSLDEGIVDFEGDAEWIVSLFEEAIA